MCGEDSDPTTSLESSTKTALAHRTVVVLFRMPMVFLPSRHPIFLTESRPVLGALQLASRLGTLPSIHNPCIVDGVAHILAFKGTLRN